ncbi:MAG: ATPase [Hyphomonadaceae bacterium]|nr:ATPase [Hyphomonadaceae bacterium]
MAAEPAHGAEGAHGAEHAAGAFPPFDASLFPHQLIWFAITFLVLYYFMSRVALPRVAEVLETRAKTIQGDLDTAAATSAAAETAKAEAERATAEARAGARKIVDDMRAEMAAALAGDRAKADEKLAAQAAAAEKRINDQRAAALSGVGAMADDLAKDIVAKLGGRA